jgi:chitin-binding protein
MRIESFRAMALCVLGALSSGAFAHGLIQDPPARNWFCGAITKPDHVANGTAQYPVCGNAFSAPGIPFEAGYSFMSVLTHTTGRNGVGPRTNVCGFNSETWNGAATVWDQPIDWPTVPMTAGPRTFTWNISWGPHFDDTQEFRYWITRPGFVWQTGRALSFADFEDTPFCSLTYVDATPNANPDVIPNKANQSFATRCTVPARSGRHVIYGEWGRNHFTFERFHGCVDAQFTGGPQPPVITANIVLSPNVTTVTGSGSLQLNGSSSVGSNLAYNWSVDSENPGLYSITNPTSAIATLNYGVPQASGNVTVNLLVTSGNASDTETRALLHQPAVSNPWFDLGPLTADPITMVVGDRVNVRTVSSTGQDAFWPTTPITITAANTGSTQWPVTLANAVNGLNGAVRIGVLNAQNQVIPQANATSNRVFSQTSANIVSAFLQRQVGNVPPAPTGLAATAGNAQVALSWGAASGATSYNVKRSTTNGGPYSNVATNVTATTFTNTGLTNGTTYYYVVTAVNANGESGVSAQASGTPSAGPGPGPGGGVTVTRSVNSSPWYSELQVRLANTQPITAMTVTVTVQRTTGVTHSGQYNTVGGQVAQSVTGSATPIVYTWTLNPGQQLGASSMRTFAAQIGGNGTTHPVTGDTWRVVYTVGGTQFEQTGAFP